MAILQGEGNEWTLTSNKAIQLVTAYLTRVSEAVCASDRVVRAMAELNGPVHTVTCTFSEAKELHFQASGELRAHPIQFKYDDEHTEYAECILDVRDVQRVKLVLWWLQTVGVRSLCLEGLQTLTVPGVQLILSTLLAEKAETTTSKPLSSVLEELAYEGNYFLHSGMHLFGALQCCQRLRKLQMKGHPLYWLQGVEGLTALQVFYGNCSELRRLDSLSLCTRLQKVYLSGCSRLESLKELEALRDLTELFIENVQMTNLTQLGGCTRLRTLKINYCANLCSLEGIEKMPFLTELDVCRCNLGDLKVLSGCTRIQKLALNCCWALRSLEGVEHMLMLKELDLCCSVLVDLSQLQWSVGLTKLNLENSAELSSLTGVEGLAALTELSFSRTGVTDLTPLRSCTKLRVLKMEGCPNVHILRGVESLQALEAIYVSKDAKDLDISAIPLDRRDIIHFMEPMYGML